MKQYENEAYEQWLLRASDFELKRALNNLVQGHDPVLVMEELANRITAKALHPIVNEIKKTSLDKKN